MSLKDPKKTLYVPWNFCKWIVDSKGRVQMYMNPTMQLHSCFEVVETLLSDKTPRKLMVREPTEEEKKEKALKYE